MSSSPRPNAERWCITGGSGYVGTNLAKHLSSIGADLRLLGRRRLLSSAVSGSRFFEADIRRRQDLAPFLEGADVVVHLAAFVHRQTYSEPERAECWDVNLEGTRNLVDAIHDVCPDAFLIFVSTISVYGEVEGVMTETTTCAPSTPYGQSKLEAERLVLERARDTGLRAAILRPAAVIGRGAPGNLQKMVGLARRGIIIDVGRGENRKSLLPVRSLIDAIVAVAAVRDDVRGEIFNVAGGTSVTMRDISDILRSATQRRPLRITVPRSLVEGVHKMSGIVRWLLPRQVDRLRQMIKIYLSTVEVDEAKLRRLTRYTPAIEATTEIRSLASDEDAHESNSGSASPAARA